MTNEVTILTGIPGTGKTKKTDELLRDNPNKRKIYLTLSHNQLDEREDFLPGVDVTHWEGMRRICPLQFEEPIATMLEINAPIRWICKLCQKMKLISVNKCPHKVQFQNPTNTVVAPAVYLFTQHPEKYKPELVVVDDVTLYSHDLPSLSEMCKYVKVLYDHGYCDYETIEELFEEQGNRLQQEILNYIEPKLKAGIQRLLAEEDEILKGYALNLLQIDPTELLDWNRLVKVYKWQEEFAIPHLMKVFELSLAKDREVYVVGALANKVHLKMLVKCFQKEYGYPITLHYQKIELDQPIAKSVVYRARSQKFPHAWFPTARSIVKSSVERKLTSERIEVILLSLAEPADFHKLNVGIVKPKKTKLEDFLTNWTNHCRVSSLDFGNLRGSNTLEHCDVLFIIGTYVVNIEDLQRDFTRVYHRPAWSTEPTKLLDGGYRYDADPDLENYRKMMEEDEMYQAIHRVRPALRAKKVYVFGLIPKEIHEEFQVRDITFEKDREGVMRLVEWKSFEKFVRERIGEKGIFQYELVNAIREEFGGQKEHTRVKIKRFVEEHKDEFEIIDKKVMGRNHPHIKRR